MNSATKMALNLMPYTCPTLDEMAKEFAVIFKNNQDQKQFFAFIENIKKDVTCPMRVALEQACEKVIEAQYQLETSLYDQCINHE